MLALIECEEVSEHTVHRASCNRGCVDAHSDPCPPTLTPSDGVSVVTDWCILSV